MPEQKYQAITLVVVVIIVLIIAGFFIFILMAYANQRKRKFIEEKMSLTYGFQQELLKTQLEIQEQTLSKISQEIHDNIGQVLSLAKINLARIDESGNPELTGRVADSRALISKAIQDLRDLSKTISPEYIADMGLLKSAEQEIENMNRAGLFNTSFSVQGHTRKLGPQRELILFRIIQELFNNTIKHAGASEVSVDFLFTDERFELVYRDNGTGFDPVLMDTGKPSGLGMKNLKNRTAMIQGEYKIESSPGNGFRFTLLLNHND